VCAVDTLEHAVPLVAPHARFLQTAGIAAEPQELFRLSEALGRAGGAVPASRYRARLWQQ
jgi:hypothetical protein